MRPRHFALARPAGCCRAALILIPLPLLVRVPSTPRARFLPRTRSDHSLHSHCTSSPIIPRSFAPPRSAYPRDQWRPDVFTTTELLALPCRPLESFTWLQFYEHTTLVSSNLGGQVPHSPSRILLPSPPLPYKRTHTHTHTHHGTARAPLPIHTARPPASAPHSHATYTPLPPSSGRPMHRRAVEGRELDLLA